MKELAALTPQERWSLVVPKPRSRSFICASTGTGKSTLGCFLIDMHRRMHPETTIYIIDEKERFVATDRPGPLFPDGYQARRHGRMEGVRVNARMLRKVNGYRYADEKAFLVHGVGMAHELFGWLLANYDVRKPVMVYSDESFSLMRGTRADPAFRALFQLGREKGIGVVVSNQRPAYVDGVYISESERLYVGRLNNDRDRRRLSETAAIEEPKRLLVPQPKFVFWLINQVSPAQSLRFTLPAKG